MAVLTLKTRGSDKTDEEWGAGLEGRMAQTMARNLRSVDFAVRLNEFEFAACIIQTDEDGAERAAGRIVKAMAAWTPDVGIAVYPQDGEDWQSLLGMALHYQGIKEHPDAVVIPFPPDRKTDAA
jgi:GGDEF domain-containing protein